LKEVLEKSLTMDDRPGPAAIAGRDYPPIERKTATFDPKVLQLLLDGLHAEIRNSVKQLISQPEFRYFDGTDVAIYRKQVLAWTKRLAATGIGRVFMPRSLGGEENLPKFIAAFETLAFHDLSLVIKLGVQFGLFAGSIQRLGTKYHHQKYLPDATSSLDGLFRHDRDWSDRTYRAWRQLPFTSARTSILSSTAQPIRREKITSATRLKMGNWPSCLLNLR
jgi:acyl-CoA oxidase